MCPPVQWVIAHENRQGFISKQLAQWLTSNFVSHLYQVDYGLSVKHGVWTDGME